MNRTPKLDKHVDKDVVLCRTTNRIVSRHTTKLLLEESIPFTMNWKRIPFYKRDEYNGASEVCVISINRNLYVKARRSIKGLNYQDRDRLLLNVI
ncbi:MAG: hypothetical protein K6B67_07690 [Lachnospiraceae bacterium]|nr:hypothetical protein [Lachnospiraceae bacterium]